MIKEVKLKRLTADLYNLDVHTNEEYCAYYDDKGMTVCYKLSNSKQIQINKRMIQKMFPFDISDRVFGEIICEITNCDKFFYY